MKVRFLLIEILVFRNVAFDVSSRSDPDSLEMSGISSLVSKLEEAVDLSSAKTVGKGDHWYCAYYEDVLPVMAELDVQTASLARHLAEVVSKRDENLARRALLGAVTSKLKTSLVEV